MIPEFGHYALVLAFIMALIQACIPIFTSITNVSNLNNKFNYYYLSRSLAWGQFIFLSISFFTLAFCFLTNDFSVAYVATNSNSHLPTFYRFCAIWGAHEGSLLLWVFILSIWSLAVSLFSKSLPLPLVSLILAILALISIGFDLFILTTSDPFLRLLPNIPNDGRDLNPILQDPGLATHPPMLYMGYVGFSVAFSFAIAALITGRLDATWARWTRPWTIIAWSFLTLGIILGSWWAYRELGWGGWWFWDPVENASFLPWLAGTALIHSLIVTEKRHVFKAWTVLLAVCAFSLSLLGTFLVRSGVLISVHAFAVDPSRGLFMLYFLLVVIGGSLAIYAWRSRYIVNTGNFSFWSREMMLLNNNLLLFVAMLTVLLGTLYPLIIESLSLGKISVGAPYFNTVFVPLILPLLFLMGIGPFFYWQKTDFKIFINRMVYLLIAVIALSSLLPWLVGAEFKWMVVLGLSLAFWIIVNTCSHLIRFEGRYFSFKRVTFNQIAMVLAHSGVAITLLGVTLNISYSQQRDLNMKLGEKVELAGYEFQLFKVASVRGPNYTGIEAIIRVRRNDLLIAVLHPELRKYLASQMSTSKTAIDVGLIRDLYVALGAPLSNDAWEVRIYYKPFVRWIWYGGILMVLGGMLALGRKRFFKNSIQNELWSKQYEKG